MASTKCTSCMGSIVSARSTRLHTLSRRTRQRVGVKASQETAQPSSWQSLPLYLLATAAPAALPMAASAEEEASAAGGASGPMILGLPLTEVAILLAPVILYSVFTIYRTAINPRVKISDFLFAIGAFVVFGNIFAILVLKIRFF